MDVQLHTGNCLHILKSLPAASVQTCVTSPPYFGLRDYQTATWEGGDPECDHKPSNTPAQRGIASSTLDGGQASNGHKQEGYRDTCLRCGARRIDDQIGLEETPDQYVAKLVAVFREVRRVLRADGTLWLNLGDTVLGKQLQGIPWRVAFALQADGWWLRSEIIWHKKAPMPESVKDRPTRAHEQVFLLTKSARYFYDAGAVAEQAVEPEGGQRGGSLSRVGNNEYVSGFNHKGNPWVSSGRRNKRSVWTLGPEPYRGAHFATMPTKLVQPCILAGSKPGDTVLDPFAGSGTTGYVALTLGRRFVGIELNPDYMSLIEQRLSQAQLPLLEAI